MLSLGVAVANYRCSKPASRSHRSIAWLGRFRSATLVGKNRCGGRPRWHQTHAETHHWLERDCSSANHLAAASCFRVLEASAIWRCTQCMRLASISLFDSNASGPPLCSSFTVAFAPPRLCTPLRAPPVTSRRCGAHQCVNAATVRVDRFDGPHAPPLSWPSWPTCATTMIGSKTCSRSSVRRSVKMSRECCSVRLTASAVAGCWRCCCLQAGANCIDDVRICSGYVSSVLTQFRPARLLLPAPFLTLVDKAILSSTNLQMLLYYNFWYSIVYGWFFLFVYRWKYLNHRGLRVQYFTPAFFGIWAVSEACRLYVGWSGNLKEDTPGMAAFLFLTIFPQMLVTVYMLAMQEPLYAFDKIFSGIMLAFLVAEFLLAWRSMGVFIADKTARCVRPTGRARLGWTGQENDAPLVIRALELTLLFSVVLPVFAFGFDFRFTVEYGEVQHSGPDDDRTEVEALDRFIRDGDAAPGAEEHDDEEEEEALWREEEEALAAAASQRASARRAARAAATGGGGGTGRSSLHEEMELIAPRRDGPSVRGSFGGPGVVPYAPARASAPRGSAAPSLASTVAFSPAATANLGLTSTQARELETPEERARRRARDRAIIEGRIVPPRRRDAEELDNAAELEMARAQLAASQDRLALSSSRPTLAPLSSPPNVRIPMRPELQTPTQADSSRDYALKRE